MFLFCVYITLYMLFYRSFIFIFFVVYVHPVLISGLLFLLLLFMYTTEFRDIYTGFIVCIFCLYYWCMILSTYFVFIHIRVTLFLFLLLYNIVLSIHCISNVFVSYVF